MLATMSEIDPRVDAPPVSWNDVGLNELPTGTVTLLLADVEGSTRLWDTQPEEMTAAVARLDRTVCDIIAAHDGVRPVEQGEGDSFVVAFARASNAVACALELQRAPLAPAVDHVDRFDGGGDRRWGNRLFCRGTASITKNEPIFRLFGHETLLGLPSTHGSKLSFVHDLFASGRKRYDVGKLTHTRRSLRDCNTSQVALTSHFY